MRNVLAWVSLWAWLPLTIASAASPSSLVTCYSVRDSLPAFSVEVGPESNMGSDLFIHIDKIAIHGGEERLRAPVSGEISAPQKTIDLTFVTNSLSGSLKTTTGDMALLTANEDVDVPVECTFAAPAK